MSDDLPGLLASGVDIQPRQVYLGQHYSPIRASAPTDLHALPPMWLVWRVHHHFFRRGLLLWITCQDLTR